MSSPNSFHESGRTALGRKRPVLVFASIFGGLVAAGAFVLFGLWIEDRYPSDDPKGAISMVAQRAITKPIVEGVSRQAVLETAYIYPSLSLEEILRRFSDARIDPAERRLFAYRLA